MADQIKQIYAGTAYIGQLSDGVPIASTNATTQNTIKDITVQNNTVLSELGINTDFVVNGFTEASLNTSVTGSEYIDVSSTAVASATVSFQEYTLENWMLPYSPSSKISLFPSKFVNGVRASTASPTQSESIYAALNPTEIVSWQTVGSDFYYWISNADDRQVLYRRAGGVNGTETVVPSVGSYMPVVFNGVDKFHWVSLTQVFTHDPATNTNTVVTLDKSSMTGFTQIYSYPRIAFANGLIFLANSTGASYVYAINPTTGKMSRITSGLFATLSTNSAFGVFMSGDNYYILSTQSVSAGGTGTLNVRTIPVSTVGTLAASNTVGTAIQVYTSVTAYTPETGLSQHWPKINSSGEFVFLSLETTGRSFVYKRFNVVTGTFGNDFTVDLSTVPLSTTAAEYAPFKQLTISDDTANKNNTTYYPQSISLRVTGVQTTL